MHITAGRGISTSKNIEIRIIATDPVDMTWIRLYERLIAFIHRIVIFSIHVQYVFGKPIHVEIFIMKLLFNFCMEFYILLDSAVHLSHLVHVGCMTLVTTSLLVRFRSDCHNMQPLLFSDRIKCSYVINQSSLVILLLASPLMVVVVEVM